MANPEHVKILEKGVNDWNQWREMNPDIKPDLSNHDLRGKKLPSINFSKTNLREAELHEAKFNNADFTGADLSNAQCRWAVFTNAKLISVVAEGVQFNDATMNGADLSNGNFQNCNFQKCNLGSSKAQKTNFTGCNFKQAKLVNAILTRSQFHKADLSRAKMMSSVFKYSEFKDTICKSSNLTTANLRFAKVRNTDFTSSNFTKADLYEVDFREANILKTVFTQAKADPERFYKGQLSQGQIKEIGFSPSGSKKMPEQEGDDSSATHQGSGGGGRDSGKDVATGFPEDDWQKDFKRFLTVDKGWLVRDYVNKPKTIEVDWSVIHPESKKLIGFISLKESIDRKIESTVAASFAQFSELELGKFLVTPSSKNSNYSFAIYKYSDRGLVRIQPENFPAYEGGVPEPPDKKLTLYDFKSKLDYVGKQIVDKVVEIATSPNINLYTDIPDESYVNLRFNKSKEKSNTNVAIQIHRWGANQDLVALAVAGVQKGKEKKEPEFKDFIVKGDIITHLSGYIKGIAGERAWLNGNLPVRGIRETASVYVIKREALVNSEAWRGVEELLEWAIGNFDKLPPKEPEEVEVEPEAVSIGSGCDIKREASEEERCLNVDSYANALSTFFKAASDGEFSFGLFGHWGRGKTYLMDIVKKKLKDDNYETIFFSAWKYRTTPEAWAHLYETFVKHFEGTKNCFTSVPCLVRTGIIRKGLWGITTCIFIFLACVLSLKERLDIVLSLYGIIGVAGIFLCLRMYFGFYRISSILKRYITFSRHGDKLGLQELIGKDIKSLIIGWVPLNINKFKTKSSVLRWFIFLLTIIAWSAIWMITKNSVYRFSYAIVTLFFAIVFLLAFYIELGEKKVKQLLLVVDDLDRCEPGQMLEIIESLKLLLEDEIIHERIQVVMLVDEEMLHHAIEEKFKAFIKNKNKTVKKEIVNEHIEKLFACYLRLPELSFDEVSEVTRKYLEQFGSIEDAVGTSSTMTATDSEDDVPENESEGSLVVDEQETVPQNEESEEKEPVASTKTREVTIEDALFSNYERERLSFAIPAISQLDKKRKWSPRSVRALLFKYQLSRLLLTVLGVKFTPKELIDALMPAIHNHSESTDKTISTSDDISRVMSQVI